MGYFSHARIREGEVFDYPMPDSGNLPSWMEAVDTSPDAPPTPTEKGGKSKMANREVI